MARRIKNERSVVKGRNCLLPGVVMFGRYQHVESQRGLLPHSHRNAIEICFLERGEQTYRIGEKVYRLRGQDQFFTLPGEVHDTANRPQERGILYWLILDIGPQGNLLGLSRLAAGRVRRELLKMPTRQFRAHPDCSRILDEIDALLQGGQGELRLQALLLEYLTRTIEASRGGARGTASPLMQRVLDYIDGHLGDPVRVGRLAQVARLSESRFKSRFRREIGVPPAEFWLRKKVERATELLKRRSVTEVAYAMGFSSSQYFATVFRRYTRMSPSEVSGKASRNGRNLRN
jgi:AraC-like DNA-binding protein